MAMVAYGSIVVARLLYTMLYSWNLLYTITIGKIADLESRHRGEIAQYSELNKDFENRSWEPQKL
ncbi:MAG: hypothetical protein ACFE9L_11955 [Candidatus Hodarchaeota archaeon]